MQRSGSQKALLVFSILEIIGAAIVLLGAIAAMGVTGLVGASGAELSPEDQAVGVAAGSLLSIVLIVSGVWSLLCGIFGIRAANDNQKIMVVWVFVIIGLVLNVLSLIMSFVNGDFAANAGSLIISIAFSVIMFVICNNIKREAGK